MVIGHETRKRTAKGVNEVLKGVGGKRTHVTRNTCDMKHM